MGYDGDMCLKSESRSLVRGVYRHYKGRFYRVLHVARHSEKPEQLVVYQEMYGSQDVWVRPIEKFQESVTANGRRTQRFTLVDPEMSGGGN